MDGDTSIQPGNMRVAHWAGTENVTKAAVVFDAPVAVVFDVDGIASYSDVDGVSGKFVAVAAGTCRYTATATAGGLSATKTGTVTVAVADDGSFTLSVLFDPETTAA